MDNYPRDPNVLSFMLSLVQMKFGNEIDPEFLNNEANRLYDLFGDLLVDYFEPMMNEDQKNQFNALIDSGADQARILEFLIASIPQLDMKIQQVLLDFRDKYLSNAIQ